MVRGDRHLDRRARHGGTERPRLSVVPLCDAHRMLTIDCAECVMRHTSACDDCVVTFVVGRRPGEGLVIDVAEERAVRMLAGAGLVPRLRHRAANA
jgi:hypothetical protein